jgi:hypothetical protein
MYKSRASWVISRWVMKTEIQVTIEVSQGIQTNVFLIEIST